MKDGARRGGGGATGGGAAKPGPLPHQHVTFSVLSTSAYNDEDGSSGQDRQGGQSRWRALALVVLGVAALAASTATLAAAPRARRGGAGTEAPTPTPSTADHERLVADLGLNGTQALLLDASRLRAYLQSDAWRERKARLWPSSPSSSSSGGGGSGSNAKSAKTSSHGIVIPAGGRDHLLNALVTVRHLRRVGCRLPIEVVHFGGAEVGREESGEDGGGAGNKNKPITPRELSSARKAASALALEPGVRLVDASLLSSPEAQRRDLSHHRFAQPQSFGKKVFAAAFAPSFRQILLLDGDSLPLLDPTPLFETPDFLSAGSMFWPDFWHNAWTDAGLWRSLGVVPPWDRDEYKDNAKAGGGGGGGGDGNGNGRRWRHRLVESGQLLIDRERHADVLEWAWLLNGANREAVYKAMHGDKDTWRLAFDMAGKSGGGYRAKGAGVVVGAAGDEEDDDGGFGDGGNDNNDNNDNNNQQGRFFLVPHMTRDAMREGPPGHEHKWHHIGVFQAAPRGFPAVLRAAAKGAAAAAAGSDGSGNGSSNNNATASLRRQAEEAFARAAAAGASAGWPLFLHRTSFNAKFFPDCARRDEEEEEEEEEEEDEEEDAAAIPNGASPAKKHRFYCRPTHASVPLADEQAGRALKPHMYAFDAQDVDDVTPTLLPRCRARLASAAAAGFDGGAAAADALANSPKNAALLLAGGEMVEAKCAPEGLGQKRGALPVHVFEVDGVWPYVGSAVDASVGVYWQVRRAFWEAD